MRAKLKAMALGGAAFVLAAAFAAPSTPATTGGHFTTSTPHVLWHGTPETTHRFTFSGGGWEFACFKAKYEATTAATTTEVLTAFPTYDGCRVGNNGSYQETEFQIKTNGCHYEFKIGKKAAADNTAQLVCPAGGKMVIELPNQVLYIVPQTFSGIAYTATTELGVNALTLDFTTGLLTAHCELGLACVFATQWPMYLEGQVRMRGTTTAGEPAGIQATGTED